MSAALLMLVTLAHAGTDGDPTPGVCSAVPAF